MVKLGMKISKAFAKIGDKTSKTMNTLGTKTHSVLKEVKGVAQVLDKKAGQIAGTAENAFDRTKQFVNKIPDYNEKAIKLGNTIVQKSGGITDVLRKSANVGDKLISGAAQLGGGTVVGDALRLASKGTHQLAVGAKKLDKTRDTADRKLNKYSDVSRQTIGDIEKVNSRKKAEMMDSIQAPEDNFA